MPQVTLAAENTEYVSLMRGVELVMSDPGSRDLPVSFIFTQEMFLDLRQELADQVRSGNIQFIVSPHSPISIPTLTPSRLGPADARRRAQDMEGLDELELVWRSDYMHRHAVSEFLKDKVRLRRKPALTRRFCHDRCCF